MFTTIQEIEAFIRDFEACSLPKAYWTHHSHLLVGLWYLSHHSFDEALAIIRQRIRNYNDTVGVANTDSSGYHETLTQFFLRGISGHLASHPAQSLPASLKTLLQSPLANKEWPLQFYSQERLFSTAARHQWVESDIIPLSR